ncbi:MAG: tetratricopeptide repeat protein [Saprospirales bacterium]|nr:tetratricopeptide repeat protein [Saprospirales bacterium]
MELEKYFDQLDAYHYGRLTGAEKEALESRLQSDPEWKEAWNLYRLSLAALELQQDATVRKTLEKIQQEKGRITPLNRRLMAVAAAVILIVCMTGSWWYAWENYTNQALYQANYSVPAEMNPARMGAGEAASTTLDRGLEAFQNKETEQAVEILETISPDNPEYENARFALGQIFLQTGKAEKAIQYLSPLTGSASTALAAKAEWYMALTLLQSGKSNECVEWLQKSPPIRSTLIRKKPRSCGEKWIIYGGS